MQVKLLIRQDYGLSTGAIKLGILRVSHRTIRFKISLYFFWGEVWLLTLDLETDAWSPPSPPPHYFTLFCLSTWFLQTNEATRIIQGMISYLTLRKQSFLWLENEDLIVIENNNNAWIREPKVFCLNWKIARFKMQNISNHNAKLSIKHPF